MNAQALCPVLIGRDEELAVLEDALFAAARGDGSIAALVGEAGVGKTRLLNELVDRARALGTTVLAGGCAEGDVALPYLPFVEAIGNWLAGVPLDEARERLGAAAPALAQLFPQLSDAPAVSADPTQARLHLYEGILAALRAADTGRGVLVIVEDIHWADASTRELLDYMTRRLVGSPVLVVVTFRPDELHRKHPLSPIVQGWRRSRSVRFIELSPLLAGDVARVIEAIFDEVVSDDFRDLMFDRTEGNPFAIEEMLKDAVDRGDIYRTADGWDRKALPELRIPSSVADGILMRLERLEPRQADVLRAAAVLGRPFTFETLLALAGGEESDVVAALEAALQQQLLVEDERARGHYRFRHALTREAIYEDLIAPRRQQLHGRAADVLRGGTETSPAELAHHLLTAGRVAEAVPVGLAAAREAEEHLGFSEAVNLYERALPHVGDPVERADVLGRLGRAAAATGDHARAAAYLRESVDALEALGRSEEAASFRLALGRVYWETHDRERARREYEGVRAALEPAGPSATLAVAYIRLAGLCGFDFRYEEGKAFSLRAIEVAEASGSDHERVWAYGFLGLATCGMGAFDEGLRWMHRSIDEAIALRFYDVASNVLHNTIVTNDDALRARDALPLVERFSELPPHPWGEFSRRFCLGLLCVRLGRLAEAEAAFTSAESTLSGDVAIWRDWINFWRARVLVERCRFDEAAAIIPPRDELASLEAQDRDEMIQTHFAIGIATGNLAAVEKLANAVLASVLSTRSYLSRVPRIATPAVRALILSDRVSDARRMVDHLNAHPLYRDHPLILEATGRVALAEGAAETAADVAARALQISTEKGYKPDALRQHLLHAEALNRLGRSDEAAREIASTIAEARMIGSALTERDARAIADAAGLAIEEPSPAPLPETEVPPISAGERLVTVMFADVRGYTAMTNREAPADMTERMTTFYRWARREIEREGGLIDAYAGDAVMASFNVTRPDMDHCVSALRAAVALQDRSSVQGLPVGVGVAVGPAVVGQLTGSEGVNVIGRTTNLAARLQAHAEDGEIVLDEEAFRRVRGWLEKHGMTATERTVQLKGFEGETRVHIVRPGRKHPD